MNTHLFFALPEQGLTKTFEHTIIPAPDKDGWVRTVDSRKFRLSNPQALVDIMMSANADIQIDWNHSSERSLTTEDNRAAGWVYVNSLRVNKKQEVVGTFEMTDAGLKSVANKEYRYLSPALLGDQETGEINFINSIGLVNKPALYLPALNERDNMDIEKPAEPGKQENCDELKSFVAEVKQRLEVDIDEKLDIVILKLDSVISDAKAQEQTETYQKQAQVARDENKKLATKIAFLEEQHFKGKIDEYAKYIHADNIKSFYKMADDFRQQFGVDNGLKKLGDYMPMFKQETVADQFSRGPNMPPHEPFNPNAAAEDELVQQGRKAWKGELNA